VRTFQFEGRPRKKKLEAFEVSPFISVGFLIYPRWPPHLSWEGWSFPNLSANRRAQEIFWSLIMNMYEEQQPIRTSISLGLGQTTCTTPGISVWHATAPVSSGISPGSHKSNITLAGMDRHSLSMEDLSLVLHSVNMCIITFIIWTKIWCSNYEFAFPK